MVRVVGVHGFIVDSAAVFAKPELLVPGSYAVLEILAVTLPREEERHLVVLASWREEVLEGDLTLALLLDKRLALLALDALVKPLGGLIPRLSILFVAVLSIHHALRAHGLAESE